MEKENKKQENRRQNAVVYPETQRMNLELPSIKEINTVSKFVFWNKVFVCLLMVIIILQICIAHREPILKYRIANLVLIFLGVLVGFAVYNKTIKIEKTIYKSKS